MIFINFVASYCDWGINKSANIKKDGCKSEKNMNFQSLLKSKDKQKKRKERS